MNSTFPKDSETRKIRFWYEKLWFSSQSRRAFCDSPWRLDIDMERLLSFFVQSWRNFLLTVNRSFRLAVNKFTLLNVVRSRYWEVKSQLTLYKNNPQIDENYSTRQMWHLLEGLYHPTLTQPLTCVPRARGSLAPCESSPLPEAWLKGTLLQAIFGYLIFAE